MKHFNIKNNCLIVNKLLESEGFKLEDHSPAGYDCDYEKVIPHDDIYTLWVNVSLKYRKVYFYDEYDCGGELRSSSDLEDLRVRPPYKHICNKCGKIEYFESIYPKTFSSYQIPENKEQK